MTGVAKNTVTKLLVDIGRACTEYQDKIMRNLPCKRIQCDEIWSFCYAKDKNVPQSMRGSGAGSVWTWTALCPDTKLIPCWFVGDRTAGSAYHFMHDLRERLTGRVQLTTDGHDAYRPAVEDAFGFDIDYAMLVKIYGNDNVSKKPSEIRYSPAQCMGAKKTIITGKPEIRHISTSHTERQNLSMRMGMRRFTRLTNAFSKKLENHEHAVALYFMFYNFARIHQTLRVTPAMEAGISHHVWTLEEIVQLLDNQTL
jgi:IS1 family transposase